MPDLTVTWAKKNPPLRTQGRVWRMRRRGRRRAGANYGVSVKFTLAWLVVVMSMPSTDLVA